ncbi:hypothetical protein NA57DRAFT_80365 [Rhizodiscina lignyota]|uniref:Uncharacterized protein n=1 Tax=Rhizodiscina lignyota TaxID=1504668 RepID=A0A9P4I6W7_9PEZI|nr:hypothetical protein NA57DRAFT_80365 [Rhizodiscina lignyota]
MRVQALLAFATLVSLGASRTIPSTDVLQERKGVILSRAAETIEAAAPGDKRRAIKALLYKRQSGTDDGIGGVVEVGVGPPGSATNPIPVGAVDDGDDDADSIPKTPPNSPISASGSDSGFEGDEEGSDTEPGGVITPFIGGLPGTTDEGEGEGGASSSGSGEDEGEGEGGHATASDGGGGGGVDVDEGDGIEGGHVDVD